LINRKLEENFETKAPEFAERLSGTFWGITSFFNLAGYKNKIENYRKFRESSKKQGLNLLCVELAFGEKEFELKKEDADILIQLRGGDALWQKERLLNIGLENLPKDCDKFAWLDCDIIFENKNWIKETSCLLENYIIVQPFSFCVRLPENGIIRDFDSLPFGSHEGERACGAGYLMANPSFKSAVPDYLRYGHPGYAWAARRKIFDKFKFYDRNILGFTDNIMVFAFYKVKTRKNWASCPEKMEKDLQKWADLVHSYVRGSVFYTSGNLLHLWHGAHIDRSYGQIEVLLKEYDFNPADDIKLNENNVWIWASDKKEMHSRIKKYFFDRAEDGGISRRIKLYSYCTPSHQILKTNWFLPSVRDDYEIIIKEFGQECPSARFLEEGWAKTIDRKIEMLIGAVKKNFPGIFIFSDIDIQFFRETKEELLQELGKKDIVFQRNSLSDPSETEPICTGFFISRCNERTLKLWEEVKKIREQNPEFIGCQKAVNFVINKIPLLSWGLLSEKFFSPGIYHGKPGWNWEPGTELSFPKNMLLHHANWTKGVENKIKQLEYTRESKEAGIGSKMECPICGFRADEFLPYGIVLRPNIKCPNCGSFDRHRLFYLYLRGLISKEKRFKILHFSPEKSIANFLKMQSNIDYLSVDIKPELAMQKENIESLSFGNNSFDIIICSHVLEHVKNDAKAIKECLRVLKPDGIALIMVPIDYKREATFEDFSKETPEERFKFFGQSDHVRIYGRDFEKRLAAAGFDVKIFKASDEKTAKRFALPLNEFLYICKKPKKFEDSDIKLSIITPVLNKKDFISNCIENFISQNCPEAEHIIIDGGSTDGTAEIIKSYAQKYPHIRYVSEKDSGQSEAMNKGIKMARGKIISLLNSDDYYELDTFSRVLEIFENLPEPSFVYGNCKIWEKPKDGPVFLRYKWLPKSLKYEDMVLHLKEGWFPPNPSGYFYHKSLHDKIGLYNELLNYVMDVDFIYRAFPAANVKYVNEDFGNFYMAENTKTFRNLLSGKRVWGRAEADYYNSLPERLAKEIPYLNLKIKNAALKRHCNVIF